MIDANVMLDFTLRRTNYQETRQIIELIVSRNLQGYINPYIVYIVGYYLSKTYGPAKAKELLLTLLADVRVIDIPHEITLHALHSKMKDIEDALQYYAAIHHKLDYFISLDRQLK